MKRPRRPLAAPRLLLYVNLLSNARYNVSASASDLGVEPPQDLSTCIGFSLQLFQGRLVKDEGRVNVAAPWCHEINFTSFVPYKVLATQALHDHQHPEWVSHREKVPPELGANVVPVPRAESKPHVHFPPIARDVRHLNAVEQEGRPKVHQSPEGVRAHVFTKGCGHRTIPYAVEPLG